MKKQRLNLFDLLTICQGRFPGKHEKTGAQAAGLVSDALAGPGTICLIVEADGRVV